MEELTTFELLDTLIKFGVLGYLIKIEKRFSVLETASKMFAENCVERHKTLDEHRHG